MVVVTPAAGNSWYVDNADAGGAGYYATAFLDELIPYIDSRFATLGRREGRAIAGLSMGGYGALRYALDRPDLFCAVASLSGALFKPRQRLDEDDIEDLHGAFGDPFEPRPLRRRQRVPDDRPGRQVGGAAARSTWPAATRTGSTSTRTRPSSTWR